MESESLNREKIVVIKSIKLQESCESESQSIIDYCDFESENDINLDSTITQTRCDHKTFERGNSRPPTIRVININTIVEYPEEIKESDVLKTSNGGSQIGGNMRIRDNPILREENNLNIENSAILGKTKNFIQNKIKEDNKNCYRINSFSSFTNVNFNRYSNDNIKSKKTAFTEISEKFYLKSRGKSCYDDLVSDVYLNKIENKLNDNLMIKNKEALIAFLNRTKNDIKIRKLKRLTRNPREISNTFIIDKSSNIKNYRSKEMFLQNQKNFEEEKELNLLKLRKSIEKEKMSHLKEKPFISQRSKKLAEKIKKKYSIKNIHARLNIEELGIDKKNLKKENNKDHCKNLKKINYKDIVNKLYNKDKIKNEKKMFDCKLFPMNLRRENCKLKFNIKTPNVKITDSSKLVLIEKFTKSYLKNFKIVSEINYEEYVKILQKLNFIKNSSDILHQDLINKSWMNINELNNNDISGFSILIFLLAVMGLYIGNSVEIEKIKKLCLSLIEHYNYSKRVIFINSENAKKIKLQFKIFYDNRVNIFSKSKICNKIKIESFRFRPMKKFFCSINKSNSVINSKSNSLIISNTKIRKRQ
jgi:hypothetical protein